MMLEVTIGETICIRMDDDDATVTRMIPEQFEEYLVRMRRQAVQCYTDLPASSLVQPGEGDEG